MKLFLFLIGGTGSRVLKPLVMQLAAGVRPEAGFKDGDELQIVPVVIDPHQGNEDLKRTQTLLSWYKDIRKELHGDKACICPGFFGIKITSLAELYGKSNKDDFVFNLSGISDKLFMQYIDYDHMDSSNQAFCQMLFSSDQLHTKMDIGFVGSPNIGCVALNAFTRSQEFERFSNVFSKEDRIFIVSSIFGGTGAAGYPLIVKNIRDAQNSNAATRGDLRNAMIGALTVMPYFRVNDTDKDGNKGRIQNSDFIVKTKSALRYYKKNLTGSGDEREGNRAVNICYYLADSVMSNPYDYDDGNNGQKNLAHFVEFVGAYSIFDFLSLRDEDLLTENATAVKPLYREFGLKRGLNENKTSLDMSDLGDRTRRLLQDKMYRFHLAFIYYSYHLPSVLSDGKQRFTHDTPELRYDLLQTAFADKLNHFFGKYIEWLGEMCANQPRSFSPFYVTPLTQNGYFSATNQLNNCILGVGHKKSIWKLPFDFSRADNKFNNLSKKWGDHKHDASQAPLKLMDLLYDGFGELLPEYFTYN